MSPLGNQIGDLTGDMPGISPAADSIANTVRQEKSDKNVTEQQSKTDKKGRGRPKGSKSSAKDKNSNVSRVGGLANPEQRDLARKAAERAATAGLAVEFIERSGVAFAGDDGKMHPIEKEGMAAAFDRYFEKANIADLPPGVALVLIMGQYYGRVLTSKPARPKVALIWDAIKIKVGKMRDARFNRRDDRQRENDTGEKPSEAIPEKRHSFFSVGPAARPGMDGDISNP